MSKRRSSSGAMLDLWRLPQGAGDPIGCLATTYTFAPDLFDEQCLARFLDIESEPNREDLAYLLERESRLGGVYVGVLVDHTQAGVEHSLRWDVLPVRIQSGKQHAKLSLLAWSRHIRIIVASANLTEPGYRSNYEVAGAIDLAPQSTNSDMLNQAIDFLSSLILFVPGASQRPPEVRRAEAFLSQVLQQTQGWKQAKKVGKIRQQLVFTLPAVSSNQTVSSLEGVVEACRRRGGSPSEVWIASPFFDQDRGTDHATASLCKLMARGKQRRLCFCVPAIRENQSPKVLRLAAPKSLIRTPSNYQAKVTIEILPELDDDKNRRPWHAKMLALRSDKYSALMTGSSNFTSAGMGVAQFKNAEANLLTIVDRVAYNREVAQLEEVWPEMEQLSDPESAEWLGAQPDHEEEHAKAPPLPLGFLSATYRAGDERRIVLRLDTKHLPQEWSVRACGRDEQELLSASHWRETGGLPVVEFAWKPVQPPEKLLVRWGDHEAFLPLNVEDSRNLPPPAQFEHMTADDMLWVLAAKDPSAAFRAWTRDQQPATLSNDELDTLPLIDLDPLRRYDLQATFLHRIRRRARVFAQLRLNLQRPVWGRQALEWRLRGIIGIESLMDRFLGEFAAKLDSTADEALLTLADFMIVLNEVDYQPIDESLAKAEFEKIYRPFLMELTVKLRKQIEAHREQLSNDLLQFCDRVVKRCQQ